MNDEILDERLQTAHKCLFSDFYFQLYLENEWEVNILHFL